jgi:hypothetical protein
MQRNAESGFRENLVWWIIAIIALLILFGSLF